MANNNQDSARGPDRRLWIAAGGVAAVAVVLAGLGGWWLGHDHRPKVAVHLPKLIGLLGENTTMLDTSLPDREKLCDAALTRALDFGAMPTGSHLADSDAKPAQPEGRYTCDAEAGDGKYTLEIDTRCPATQQNACFALDGIRREDGTWTYRRENQT
ncbi:MAG: hypothetical protein JOZ13_04815 [Alphaproteobacteria bacterium]|nr:hypothetical protein [Alphaproteobacteria bacterium]